MYQVEQERRRREEQAVGVGHKKEQLEQTVCSLEQELSETQAETNTLKVRQEKRQKQRSERKTDRYRASEKEK